MSQAFVRENDEQWLHEISPTLAALENYLSRQNNGIRVYLKQQTLDPSTKADIYHMSNGLDYGKDENGTWMMR